MIMKEAEEQAKWCCDVGLTCRIGNLSFGHKAMERDEKKGKVSSIGIKVKPKKKTEEKKKKAPKLNLLSYGEEDSSVCWKQSQHLTHSRHQR